MKYVVLLRGVNVGGNHRVPKLEFQKVLESLGFSNVTIYINSGNAVFDAAAPSDAATIRAALERHFGFEIPTLLLSAEKMRAIAAAIPDDWTNDVPTPDKAGQKSDVLYLFDEINQKQTIEAIGYKPDIETMLYVDGAILTNITRAHQSRGSLQKLIATPFYKNMTIRNITTAKKLAALCEEAS